MSRVPDYIPEDLRPKVESALAIIDLAFETYPIFSAHIMFSGGGDSTALMAVASLHPKVNSAVHINTGIGIPETREYVKEICDLMNFPLEIYRPNMDRLTGIEGAEYEDMVMKNGFPGASQHGKYFNKLKKRGVEALIRDKKAETDAHPYDQLLAITGVRSDESARRFNNINEPVNKEYKRSLVWCAPIHDWSKNDCRRMIAARQLPANPVVEKMCMSGECLCGAFAAKDEMKELELWYPTVAAKIKELESKVKATGSDRAAWGSRDPQRVSKEAPLTDFLCTSCEVKSETNNE